MQAALSKPIIALILAVSSPIKPLRFVWSSASMVFLQNSRLRRKQNRFTSKAHVEATLQSRDALRLKVIEAAANRDSACSYVIIAAAQTALTFKLWHRAPIKPNVFKAPPRMTLFVLAPADHKTLAHHRKISADTNDPKWEHDGGRESRAGHEFGAAERKRRGRWH